LYVGENDNVVNTIKRLQTFYGRDIEQSRGIGPTRKLEGIELLVLEMNGGTKHVKFRIGKIVHG